MNAKGAFFTTIFGAILGCVALAPAADSETARIVTVRVAADSQNEGYEACRALDGNPETFWHSEFSNAPFANAAIPIYCGYWTGCNADHPARVKSRRFSEDRPFELRVDLGGVYALNGIRYTPRADGVENGSVDKYEIYALEEVGENVSSPNVPNELMAPDFASDGIWNAELGSPVATGDFNGTTITV